MANNRMWLICNVCIPVDSEWPKDYLTKTFHVAKWYPSDFVESSDFGLPGAPFQKGNGAYYTNTYDDDAKVAYVTKLDEFLASHEHLEFSSQHYRAGSGQPNPVRLEYESEDLPVLL